MRRPRFVGCGSRSVHSLGQQLADNTRSVLQSEQLLHVEEAQTACKQVGV